MIDAVLFLAGMLIKLLIYLVLARVLLQLCKADRYNPLAQGIVQFTDTFLAPLRRFLPKSVRWDIAGVVVLVLLGMLSTVVGRQFGLLALLSPQVWLISLILLFDMIIDAYLAFIFLTIVASFVAQGSYHPALVLLRQLTAPLLDPVQRRVPPIGGLDFSPMIVIVALVMVQRFLLPALIEVVARL